MVYRDTQNVLYRRALHPMTRVVLHASLCGGDQN